MHSTAPVIIASPRQAPSGAAPRPEASAAKTPSMAMETPSDLRNVSRSMPSSAATIMVCSGKVDSARLARAGAGRNAVWLADLYSQFIDEPEANGGKKRRRGEPNPVDVAFKAAEQDGEAKVSTLKRLMGALKKL